LFGAGQSRRRPAGQRFSNLPSTANSTSLSGDRKFTTHTTRSTGSSNALRALSKFI